MQQRTCNIIMCCKFHCKLLDEDKEYTAHNAIIAYLSRECACPVEYYESHPDVIRWIVLEALYDYLNCASNPGYVMRQVFEDVPFVSESLDASLLTRIYRMFQLVQVKDTRGKDDVYVNGFTDALIAQSDIALSCKRKERAV